MIGDEVLHSFPNASRFESFRILFLKMFFPPLLRNTEFFEERDHMTRARSKNCWSLRRPISGLISPAGLPSVGLGCFAAGTRKNLV